MAQDQNSALRLRAERALVEELDALAAALSCSRSEVVAHAVAQFSAANRWQTARIKRGLDAARAGKTRDADAVLRNIARKLKTTA